VETGKSILIMGRPGIGKTTMLREAARVLAPVRTYESPVDRRLEEEGFDSIAVVTLLMKETLVRVAEPRLVPAGVR
jgi:MoxR-like ATPase